MLDSFGVLGWLGVGLLLVGVGVIAYANPLVAAGLVIVLVGLGLVLKEGIDRVMTMFGMA